MKSLKESLFDKDLIKRSPELYQLKNLVTFDGQWVLRLDDWQKRLVDIKVNNVLSIIDWRKVKQDLKKLGGEDIDLGLYPYANSSDTNVRTAETNKKTEMFARLIMSIPYTEELHLTGFNSRFRDEFLPKLNDYILKEYRDKEFSFEEYNSRYALVFTLKHPATIAEFLRFEFVEK